MTTNTFDWVGSILTLSNKRFNITEPTPDMVDLNDIAHSLSLICRYNGHIAHHYSVAEHSVRVAQDLRASGYGSNVVLQGLMHDAAEAYMGDMVRPLKRTHEVGTSFQVLENKVLEVIFSALDVDYPLDQAVFDADKRIYLWEVSTIREKGAQGWSASVAEEVFLAEFDRVSKEVTRDRAVLRTN